MAYGSPVNHTFTADKTVNNAYLKVKNAAGIEQRYYLNIKVGGEVGAVKNPDTFTLVTIGEPDNLDPAVDYETAGGEVIANVYETSSGTTALALSTWCTCWRLRSQP